MSNGTFDYVAFDAVAQEQQRAFVQVSEAYERMLDALQLSSMAPCAELEVARVKLQELHMWACKGVRAQQRARCSRGAEVTAEQIIEAHGGPCGVRAAMGARIEPTLDVEV